MPTEIELTLEQTQQGVSYEVSNIRVISFTMKMEILLEPTSNKLMVGYELTIDDEFLKCLTLSIRHKTTLASDTSSDFQIYLFSISIGEIVTHWFTLIVLSALRRSDNENMLSTMNLILMSILTDLKSRMDGRTCNIKQKCVMNQTPRQLKRGRDTKIPQSSGSPEKVGDEDVHKELGDIMDRAATTASSLKAKQDSGNINRTQSMATLNEQSP
ncbi:hypothetical protein Tco_0731869 [Tanacetum coccineum]